MRFTGLFLLLLLLTGCVVRPSQSTKQPFRGRTLSVSGYVLDATSCQPVAGVPITKNGVKTITAQDGFFRLKYPEAEFKEYRRDGGEALRVYSLNYAGSTAIPADTTQPVTLLLVRNTYRFPPQGFLNLADSTHATACVSPWLGLPGSQRAFLVQDSTCRQPRKLRALTFRVGNDGIDGFIRYPLRVRIYQYNGPELPPGSDLLPENYIIIAQSAGIFTYDLSGFDVTVSGSGFFLALKYPVGSDKVFGYDPMIGYSPIGPILHPPYLFAATRTWECSIGKGWQPVKPTESCWPLYESAISVEVEPAPAKH